MNMNSTSSSYTATFKISQAVEILFPLFTPEGEKLWVPNWEYENIMGTTDLYEDYIFLTHSHDHAANKAIWIVKKYDPEKFYVQYYKIEPDEKLGIVTIKCHALDRAATNVEVTYKYIGLSESGNSFIRQFTQKDYENFIKEWKRLLEEYFAKNHC